MSEANSDKHVARLFAIYLALMVLLVLTVAVSRFDMGNLNIVVAMTIAIIKAVVVVLVFMHVMHSGKLVWICSTAAFVWLGIMLALTFSDYLTRSSIPKSDAFRETAPFAHPVDSSKSELTSAEH